MSDGIVRMQVCNITCNLIKGFENFFPAPSRLTDYLLKSFVTKYWGNMVY